MANALNQAFHDFFIANGFAFQITHHAIIVSFHSCFNHLFTSFFSSSLIFIRNFDFVGAVAISTICFHLVQIDNALEVILFTQGQLQRQHVLTKFAAQVIKNAVKISIFTIHFVYENNAGQTSLFSQLPALLGANLYTAGCAYNNQSAVHCSESALYFGYEIGEARSIDKVDFGIAPFNGSQGCVYGNLTFDFLRLIVSGGSTVFYLTHSADSTAAIQQSFGNRRGSCSTMTHNGHVSNFIASIFFHDKSPFYYRQFFVAFIFR